MSWKRNQDDKSLTRTFSHNVPANKQASVGKVNNSFNMFLNSNYFLDCKTSRIIEMLFFFNYFFKYIFFFIIFQIINKLFFIKK